MKKLASVLIAGALFCSGEAFSWGYYGGPLCPGEISISERGGIEPAFYTHRQLTDVTNIVNVSAAFGQVIVDITEAPTVTTNTLVLDERLLTQTDAVRAPKFSDQFDTPWMLGGEIAYAISCNTEVFVDGSYSEAQGRTAKYRVHFPAVDGFASTTPPFPLVTDLAPHQSVHVREKYSDLETYGAHLGARYYFSCCSSCVYPFVGLKVGFRHRDSLKARVRGTFEDAVNGTVPFDAGKVTYYPSHNVLSAGFQLGINFRFSECLSLVLMGEAVGTGAYKFGKGTEVDRGVINTVSSLNTVDNGTTITVNDEVQTAASILQIPVRRNGTIMTFPIHLGIRFSF